MLFYLCYLQIAKKTAIADICPQVLSMVNILFLLHFFQKFFCALEILSCFGHDGAVYLIDFCPCVLCAPGPLSGRPCMCATEISIFPIVDRWHLHVVIMNECQQLFMCPIRKRTVSRHALPVGINIVFLADIVPIGSPSSEKQHIQLVLLVILRLPSVLDNMEPLSRIFAILRKKHVRMGGQPFYILPCVYYGQFRRLMSIHPFCKCFILQIANNKHTGGYPCSAADFS